MRPLKITEVIVTTRDLEHKHGIRLFDVLSAHHQQAINGKWHVDIRTPLGETIRLTPFEYVVNKSVIIS